VLLLCKSETHKLVNVLVPNSNVVQAKFKILFLALANVPTQYVWILSKDSIKTTANVSALNNLPVQVEEFETKTLVIAFVQTIFAQWVLFWNKLIANAHVPKQIAELVLVKSLINQIANADALLMLHAHLVKLETLSPANVFAQ
jgi:hypothetical protein